MQTKGKSNTGLSPIDNSTIVDKIIDRIVQAIASGQFKVGEKLPSEFELVEELNVGRNSLREAMKILSALGVVSVRRGDGTYVCDHIAPTVFNPIIYSIIFRAESDPDMVEFRQLMEEVVLKTAMKKITPDGIKNLEQIISSIRRAYKNGDKAKAAHLDYTFHVAIADICDNPYLSKIVNGIYEIFSLSIEDTINTQALFDNAEGYHKKILHCLETKDESAIEEVVAESLTFWHGDDAETTDKH